jgi:hypothetical protein
MFELIPSEYMRMVFKTNDFIPTDFNKATLIWNNLLHDRNEKIAALETLQGLTADGILKQQIKERLEFEDNMFNTMIKNSDGKYVFTVLDEDEYCCGFFSEYEMAHKYGIENAHKYDEKSYKIEKQLIIREKCDLMVRDCGRINWNMIPSGKTIETIRYEGNPVSSISFSANGGIKHIWSNEMAEEAEFLVDPYRTDRFEHQFFRIPFEGTIGWTVRDITDGTIGVLMQDTKGWQKYMDRSIYRDYFDIQVEVVFLTPQGCWSHEHINPIYLELDHPLGESAKSLAMGRAMEFLCEYLIRFEKGVETKWYDEQALAAAREYRDLCFKEMIEEEKKKNGIVDRAKTIEELII